MFVLSLFERNIVISKSRDIFTADFEFLYMLLYMEIVKFPAENNEL